MKRIVLVVAMIAMTVVMAAPALAQSSISLGGDAVITSSKVLSVPITASCDPVGQETTFILVTVTQPEAGAPSWRARDPSSRSSATRRPTPIMSPFPGPAPMEAHGDPVPRHSPPSSAPALRRTARSTAPPKRSSRRQRSPWSAANLAVKGGESAERVES
jgi:hypothetical protein